MKRLPRQRDLQCGVAFHERDQPEPALGSWCEERRARRCREQAQQVAEATRDRAVEAFELRLQRSHVVQRVLRPRHHEGLHSLQDLVRCELRAE